MIKNKLKLLEKENQEALSQITSANNRKNISDMFRYVSSFALPLYQTQIIHKDLLGMALEAEKQNLTLQEKLGVEPLAFRDDIIENIKSTARHERFLRAVLNTLQAFAFYCTFAYFFFYSMPQKWGITLTEVILFVLWCGVMNHVTKFWADRSALQSGKWRRNAPYAAFTLISVILFVAIRKTGLGAIYIITGPGWALVLIVDIITLTATLAWNYYIGRFH